MLDVGQASIHSGTVEHRGLPNIKDVSRSNVFLSVQPANLDVRFELD